jgi:hypothetical protein
MTLAATTCKTGAIVTIHNGFFTVVVIYAGLMALWGFALYLRGSNPSGSYLGGLVFAEGVAVFQVVVGLIVLFTGHGPPHDWLHYLYGAAAALALPVGYTYSARGTERRDSLVFAIAALVVLGVAIRASATGCA